ncbi:hypothetical protein CRG98_018074, partial [Punica granatum]
GTKTVTAILRSYIDYFYKPGHPIVKFHKDVPYTRKEFLFGEWKSYKWKGESFTQEGGTNGANRKFNAESSVHRVGSVSFNTHAYLEMKATGSIPSVPAMFEKYHKKKGD